MEIQEIYNQFSDYYGELEAEYAHCQKASMEWESLHLRYLIYYLMRYGIGEMKFFNVSEKSKQRKGKSGKKS